MYSFFYYKRDAATLGLQKIIYYCVTKNIGFNIEVIKIAANLDPRIIWQCTHKQERASVSVRVKETNDEVLMRQIS